MELMDENIIECLEKIEGRHLKNKYIQDCSIQMVDCLEQIHSMNTLHRDIKPANFMLKDGKVHLIDFGLRIEYLNNEEPR